MNENNKVEKYKSDINNITKKMMFENYKVLYAGSVNKIIPFLDKVNIDIINKCNILKVLIINKEIIKNNNLQIVILFNNIEEFNCLFIKYEEMEMLINLQYEIYPEIKNNYITKIFFD